MIPEWLQAATIGLDEPLRQELLQDRPPAAWASAFLQWRTSLLMVARSQEGALQKAFRRRDYRGAYELALASIPEVKQTYYVDFLFEALVAHLRPRIGPQLPVFDRISVVRAKVRDARSAAIEAVEKVDRLLAEPASQLTPEQAETEQEGWFEHEPQLLQLYEWLSVQEEMGHVSGGFNQRRRNTQRAIRFRLEILTTGSVAGVRPEA